MKSAISHHGRWFRNKDSGFWLLWLFAQRCTINYVTIALREVRSDWGRGGEGYISMQARSIFIHSQLGFDEHLAQTKASEQKSRANYGRKSEMAGQKNVSNVLESSVSVSHKCHQRSYLVSRREYGGAGVTRSDGEKFVTYMYSSYPNYV